MHFLLFCSNSSTLLVLVDSILSLLMSRYCMGIAYLFRPGALTLALCVRVSLKLSIIVLP